MKACSTLWPIPRPAGSRGQSTSPSAISWTAYAGARSTASCCSVLRNMENRRPQASAHPLTSWATTLARTSYRCRQAPISPRALARTFATACEARSTPVYSPPSHCERTAKLEAGGTRTTAAVTTLWVSVASYTAAAVWRSSMTLSAHGQTRNHSSSATRCGTGTPAHSTTACDPGSQSW